MLVVRKVITIGTHHILKESWLYLLSFKEKDCQIRTCTLPVCILCYSPSQKFNMCDFVASSQDFAAKAVIACDHWCPSIMKHRVLLCALLIHVWKPVFRGTVRFAKDRVCWRAFCTPYHKVPKTQDFFAHLITKPLTSTLKFKTFDFVLQKNSVISDKNGKSAPTQLAPPVPG